MVSLRTTHLGIREAIQKLDLSDIAPPMFMDIDHVCDMVHQEILLFCF